MSNKTKSNARKSKKSKFNLSNLRFQKEKKNVQPNLVPKKRKQVTTVKKRKKKKKHEHHGKRLKDRHNTQNLKYQKKKKENHPRKMKVQPSAKKEVDVLPDGSLQKLDDTIETLIKNGMRPEDTSEIRWDFMLDEQTWSDEFRRVQKKKKISRKEGSSYHRISMKYREKDQPLEVLEDFKEISPFIGSIFGPKPPGCGCGKNEECRWQCSQASCRLTWHPECVKKNFSKYSMDELLAEGCPACNHDIYLPFE